MGVLADYPLITAAELTGSHVAYACPQTGTDPKDKTILYSEVVAWLAANGLIASALIDEPNGVAGLDANGNLVGPILLQGYADAAAVTAAIGTPPLNYMLVVGGKLHLGDNATAGGNRVGYVAPGFFTANTTGSITLDPFAGSSVVRSTLTGSNITITIANLDDLPPGYVIHGYCEKTGAGDTIGFDVLGDIVMTGTTLLYMIVKYFNGPGGTIVKDAVQY